MSYRLSFDEAPAESLRRAAREQLEAAATELESEHQDDPVETVHDVRKRLKKSRSVLRLARPAMARSAYRRENTALRDRGRALSGIRDADVMIETVDALAERFAGQLPAALFTDVRKRLESRATVGRDAIGPAIPDHAAAVRTLAARVDDWRLDRADPDALAAALQRTYGRGRRAFARADRKPTTDRLHEWRKRAKDLWYHERLLRPAWPGLLKAQADEAKALSKLLGDDHDLAVLADLVAADETLTAGAAADREALLGLIAQRRGELLAEARALGARVYAERPKDFGRRLRRYVRLAADERPAVRAA